MAADSVHGSLHEGTSASVLVAGWSTSQKVMLAALIGLCACLYLIEWQPPANGIQVNHRPSQELLRREGVFQWATWVKEPSEFDWHFTEAETAYVLEGEVYLTPEGSTETVVIRPGDFVKFAPGLRCHWRVTKPFKKRVTEEPDLIGKWRWQLTFGLQSIARRITRL